MSFSRETDQTLQRLFKSADMVQMLFVNSHTGLS